MAPSATPSNIRRTPRWGLRFSLVVGAIFSLGLLLYSPELVWWVGRLPARAGKALGGSVQSGRVRYDWLQSTWKVRDLVIHRPGLAIKAEKVRVALDLWALARGGDPLDLLDSMEVDDWSVEILPGGNKTQGGPFPPFPTKLFHRQNPLQLLAQGGKVKFGDTSMPVDMFVLAMAPGGQTGFYLGVGRHHMKGTLQVGDDGLLSGSAETGAEGFKSVPLEVIGQYEPQAWRLLLERRGGDGGLRVGMDGATRSWNLRYYHVDTPLSETLSWFGLTNLAPSGIFGEALSRAGIRLGSGDTRSRIHAEWEGQAGRVEAVLWRPRQEQLKVVLTGSPSNAWTAAGSWWGRGQMGFQVQQEKGDAEGRLWVRGIKVGETPISGDLVFRHSAGASTLDFYPAGGPSPVLAGRVRHHAERFDFTVSGGNGGLSLDGSWSRTTRSLTRLRGDAKAFTLGPLADALSLPAMREWVLDGQGALEGPGVYGATVRATHGVTGREVFRLAARADEKLLRIGEFRWGTGIHAWGEASLAEGGRSAFTLVAGPTTNAFSGVSRRRNGELVVALKGISGGGEAEWHSSPDRWQLGVKDWPLAGRLRLSGEASGVEGEVSGKLKLNGLSPWDDDLVVESGFTLNPGGAELGQLHLSDAENHLWGFGVIRWGDKPGYRISLGGVKEPVRIDAEGEFAGGEHRGRLLLQQADLSLYKHPLRKILPGRTRAHAVFSGPFSRPNISLRFLTDPYRYFKDPHRLQGEIEFWDGTLDIRRVELERPEGAAWKPVARIQRARISAAEAEVVAELNGFPTLWQTDGRLQFTWDRARRTAVFSTVGLMLDGQPSPNVQSVAVQTEDGWIFSAPEGEGLTGTLKSVSVGGFLKKSATARTLDLEWRHLKRPVLKAEGRIEGENLDVVVSTARFQASYLRPLFSLTEDETPGKEVFDMDLAGRHLTGVNLAAHVHGTTAKPLISGRALATGRFRLYGTSERLDAVRVPIEIDENVVTLKRGVARWADGGELGVEGIVSFKGLTGVDAFDLRLTARDFKADWKGGPLEVQGKIRGEAQLTGSGFYPKIAGRITLSEGGMVMAPSGGGGASDWADRQKRFYNRIKFDLDLVAGSRSRLESPVFEMQLTPGGEARFAGTLYNDEWGVTGALAAQGGIFIHQGTEFRVKRMALNFPQGGNASDPWVEVDGVTKVREGTGMSIDISLVKRGRLSDSQVTISASPGRTPEEIRILLGWADPNQTAGNRSGVSAGSRVMANAMLFRPLERSLRRGLGLDYVRIDTDLYALSEAMRLGSNSGSMTTTFSMGKYLAENLFFQSDFNLGLGTTNTFGGALNLEYDLGLFNLGGRVEVKDLTRLPGTPRPVDFSLNLNKNWSF